MSIQIGVYDAKTQLSDLINKAQAGERVTITVRGRPAVELAPVKTDQTARRKAAGAALLEMMARGSQVSDEELQEMQEDGRK